ncbi:hypothetical protein GCM10010461_23110 [Microbacterium aurantiacum]
MRAAAASSALQIRPDDGEEAKLLVALAAGDRGVHQQTMRRRDFLAAEPAGAPSRSAREAHVLGLERFAAMPEERRQGGSMCGTVSGGRCGRVERAEAATPAT